MISSDSSLSSFSSSLSSSTLSSGSSQSIAPPPEDSSQSSLSSSSVSSISSSGELVASLARATTTADLQIGTYRERSAIWLIKLLDVDGQDVVFEDDWRVRVKIGRNEETPILDLVDGVATVNGTHITKINPVKLFLHQDDMSFAPGIYDLQIAILDNAQAQNITYLASGHFTLYGSVGGGDIIVGPIQTVTAIATEAILPTSWFKLEGIGEEDGGTPINYSLPTGGTTYNVAASATTAQVQAILDGLQGKDVVILDKDGVWDSLVLRKTSGTDWKYIISSDVASLPIFGARVTSTDSTSMPTLRTTIPGNNLYPALNTEVGASYYHIAGLHLQQQTYLDPPILQKPRIMMLGRVPIGGTNGTLHPTSLGANYDTVGDHIIIDRCIFEGEDQNSYRGLYLDANDSVVIGCYFYKIFVDPSIAGYSDENIGIEVAKIRGRCWIENNYISAGGICVMIGDDDVGPFGIPPLEDIVVSANTLTKDTAWASVLSAFPGTASLKNHIECKGGNRLLWEDNTMVNQFFGNQGRSIVIKVGGNSETDNVTVRNNTISDITGAISIHNPTAAQRMGAIAVRDNSFTGIGIQPGTTLVEDTIIMYSDGLAVENVLMEDNVFVRDVATEKSHIGIFNAAQYGVTNFTYRRNTSPAGAFGVKASGTPAGVASLDVLAQNWQFTDNTITNSTGLNYPPGNTLS
jgi:hypothetical protein